MEPIRFIIELVDASNDVVASQFTLEDRGKNSPDRNNWVLNN
jgi:hypothetical protein